MRRNGAPTALERLIEPLPDDLKAAVLEAWKNEDIPHDENDSLYRLMLLLTLYARYFEQIPARIADTESRFRRLMDGSTEQFQRIWNTHVETLQVIYTRLDKCNGSLQKTEKVLEEKPKSLRLQFETDLETLLNKTKKTCNDIQTGMSNFWARIKEDQEGVIFHQHMTYFAVGTLAGIFIAVLTYASLHHG